MCYDSSKFDSSLFEVFFLIIQKIIYSILFEICFPISSNNWYFTVFKISKNIQLNTVLKFTILNIYWINNFNRRNSNINKKSLIWENFKIILKLH